MLILPEFLTPEALELALAGCRHAHLATFCGHRPAGGRQPLRNEFFEPIQGHEYVTIHQRPPEPVPELQALHELFAKEATVTAFENLTGLSPAGTRQSHEVRL
jgi:hypothetical protein